MEEDYRTYLERIHGKRTTPSEVLGDVLQRILGRPPENTKKIVAGEINEVYEADVAGVSYIVRISRREEERFTLESWALDAARNAGVATPKLFGIESATVDGSTLTFCVQSKLEGESLSAILERPPRDAHDIIAIGHTIGETLSQLHSVHTSGYGTLIEPGKGELDSMEDWLLDINEERDEIITALQAAGLSASESQRGFSILEVNKSLFTSDPPSLVHGDFGPKHIFMKDGKVSGVIDFEDAQSTTPLEDVARWKYWFDGQLPAQLLQEGYGQSPLFEGDVQRKLDLLQLRMSLWTMHYYWKQQYNGGLQYAGQKYRTIVSGLK